jgi:hypothetical protein
LILENIHERPPGGTKTPYSWVRVGYFCQGPHQYCAVTIQRIVIDSGEQSSDWSIQEMSWLKVVFGLISTAVGTEEGRQAINNIR